MSRQCIFCGSPAQSREHLWPEWIHRKLTTDRPLSHSVGKAAPKIIRNRKIKIKKVCETCNNGWMHILETKSSPLISVMIQPTSLSIALDPVQQLTVSEWAAKTAMVLDSVDTQTRPLFYEQPERDAMRLKLSLPDDTTIWLGRCSVEGLAAHGTTFGIFEADKITKIADACASTIAVGRLVIQVLTIHRLAAHVHSPFHVPPKPGNWNNLLVQIYPLNPLAVAWPPPQSFDPASVNNLLADRWRIGQKL